MKYDFLGYLFQLIALLSILFVVSSFAVSILWNLGVLQ